jgi:hypothetical protein
MVLKYYRYMVVLIFHIVLALATDVRIASCSLILSNWLLARTEVVLTLYRVS